MNLARTSAHVGLMIAALLPPARALAQCDDWHPGPLQNNQTLNGSDGTVYALTTWGGMLVAGGNFSRMQDATAHDIAVFDPVSGAWAALGNPPFNTDVRCFTVFNGQLIAGGGSPQTGLDRAFLWNGSDWFPLDNDCYIPPVPNMSPLAVTALTVFQNAVIGGGNFLIWETPQPGFTCSGQFGFGVVMWDGARHWLWQPSNFYAQAAVLALQQYQSQLIVGGNFSAGCLCTLDCPCNPGNHVAAWDGANWSDMAGGLNDDVQAFTIFNGDLIAGGVFTTIASPGIIPPILNRIARWDGSSWQPLGSGLSGPVTSLTVFNGDLIVGGNFTVAGGVAASHIARWDGSAWHALGRGTNDIVESLTVYQSQLIAGGDFTTAGGQTANHIARWDGTQWSSFGGGSVTNVLALAAFGPSPSQVIAGGNFQQSTAFDQSANNIVAWNGLQFSALGSGMNGQVQALKTYNTGLPVNLTYHLAAGGVFTSAGGVTVNRIALWSQSSLVINPPVWVALGPGLNNTVRAIERFNNLTIAGGDFTATGNGATTLNHIAQWNGTSWSQLGTGLNGTCNALKVYNNALYAGGSFTFANGTVHTGGLARWDGSAWTLVVGTFNGTVDSLEVYNNQFVIGGLYPGISGSPNIAQYNSVTNAYSALGTGGTDGEVYSLLSENGNLYIGGAFTHAGGISATHLARWDGAAWGSVRGGADSTVFALLGYHDEVHAGGAFSNVRSGAISSPGWARYFETGIPWFVTQPTSATASCNAEVSFSGHSATGYSQAVTWLHNSVPLSNGPTGTGSTIAGAGNDVIDILHVNGADQGNYQLMLTNSCGSATSNGASLTVIPSLAADLDGDCDVDHDDFLLFASCMSGPTVPLTPGCENRDFDHDGDVDMDDFAIWQRCYSGSGIPAVPNCAD